MSFYDVKNAKYRNKSNPYNNAKSARNRVKVNMPNLTEFRRTKSSVLLRENPNTSLVDTRGDSFSAQFQKQILTRKSFLSDNTKSDKQINPILVIRRKPEEKLKNPDRICFDRQNLTNCPILENEENLRLLNYQYNFISQIQNLEQLKKLILLDLYDNRIEKISGLENLRCLRVLMLGRNRISKIEGLSNLTRLDVLDLHGNMLKELENIGHLSELRVLNVAGNDLHLLDNLRGLVSLVEVNARRNSIESVVDVNSIFCPNLQRVYLSYNNLMKMSDFQCLEDVSSLMELSIDNNPVSRHSNIRSAMITNYPQLEQLDLKPILEEEKARSRQVMNRLEASVKPNTHLSRHLNLNSQRSTDDSKTGGNNMQKFHSIKDRRKLPINGPVGGSAGNKQQQQQQQSGNIVSNQLALLSVSNSGVSGEHGGNPLYVTEPSNNSSVAGTERDSNLIKSNRFNKLGISQENSEQAKNDREFVSIEETLIGAKKSSNVDRPSQVRPGSSSSSAMTKSDSTNDINKTRITNISSTSDAEGNSISDSNITLHTSDTPILNNEVDEMKVTSIEALRKMDDREFWISTPSLCSSVTTIVFQNINFHDLEKYFPVVKSRLPNLKQMVLSSNRLSSFKQINSLAALKRLEDLTIRSDNNPITSFKFLRNYVIFRLCHLGLKSFNEIEITNSEYFAIRHQFLPLVSMSPNYISQLHRLGVINDVRRRELMHSVSDSSNIVSSSLASAGVSIDMMSKFGIFGPSELNGEFLAPNDYEQNVSAKSFNSVMGAVENYCQLTESFHQGWLGIVLNVLHQRLEPMLTNRNTYMRRQLADVMQTSSGGGNVNSSISNNNTINNNR